MERNWSKVHNYCKIGDAESLRELLNSVEDITFITMQANEEGMLPIHTALVYARANCVKLLLSSALDMPFLGMQPLHLAFSLAGFEGKREDCGRCVELLLDQEATDVNAQDRLGRTPLHLACAHGMSECIKQLFIHRADGFSVDFAGRYAIHTAIAHNQAEAVRVLFSECGHIISQLADGQGDLPPHQATKKQSWQCLQVLVEVCSPSILETLNEKQMTCHDVAAASNVLDDFVRITTLNQNVPYKKECIIVTHEVCREHAALPPSLREVSQYISQHKRYQPENPYRLEALNLEPFGALLSDEFTARADFQVDPRPAMIADILRVHEYSYYLEMSSFIEDLSGEGTPAKLDKDTFVSAQSLKAAQIAAGAVTSAVDQVLECGYRTAFCCVRPPGHHVGPMGAVHAEEDPSQTSQGFCLLNNVAIGAAYALYKYSHVVRRVAIVDFDVHHGNGTEAIVKNLRPHQVRVNINSTAVAGSLELHSYKPWFSTKDHHNVLFVSTHAYGTDGLIRFYPASGTYCSPSNLHPAGILNIPLEYGTDSFKFRENYEKRVFPRVLKFKPDIIIVSAGFDGHELDKVNHNFMTLDEDDFTWVTENLLKVANRCCNGRLISVLEGGYNISGGFISPLSQSVAAHLRVLVSQTREVYSPDLSYEREEQRRSLKRKFIEDENSIARGKRHRIITIKPRDSSSENDEESLNSAQDGSGNLNDNNSLKSNFESSEAPSENPQELTYDEEMTRKQCKELIESQMGELMTSSVDETHSLNRLKPEDMPKNTL